MVSMLLIPTAGGGDIGGGGGGTWKGRVASRCPFWYIVDGPMGDGDQIGCFEAQSEFASSPVRRIVTPGDRPTSREGRSTPVVRGDLPVIPVGRVCAREAKARY